MYDDRDIARVLDATHIEDVVRDFVPLQESGHNYKCCCPVHNERTPSFVVTPSKNMYYCFGCHIGGNAIDFLMTVEGMTFREAVEYLAKKSGTTIEDKTSAQTAAEAAINQKREAMLHANRVALEYYASRMSADDTDAQRAKEYANNRWGVQYVQLQCIGYAPGHGAFRDYAKTKGLSTDILVEVGLLRRDEKGNLRDYYYNRIVIPIRSQSNQVLGFTARALDDDGPKYINSPASIVYSKKDTIFGLNAAARQIASDEIVYLVEGAPDVMRLQSIGVANTVASLGTEWSSSQFDQLRRYNPTICFIPDADPPKKVGDIYGPGIAAVIKNGLAALRQGFRVIVKEIPQGKDKQDPDSYITSRAILDSLHKQDFVPWYAEKLLIGKETASERAPVMKEVAKLLAEMTDADARKALVRQTAKVFGVSSAVVESSVSAVITKGEKRSDDGNLINQELYRKYGFCERDNYYYSLSKEGEPMVWSNFVMQPLFHIKDQLSPKRLYKITNINRQTEIVELKQEDLVSLQRFKLKVEGIGNYIWKAKDDHLTKLKGYLYEQTETATEITQLGWQKDDFFAFGNGVLYNGIWMAADEYGIVKLPDVGNYYLPAASSIYRNERKLFQFERKFVHTTMSEITLRQYTDKLVAVFGNNAKVGICFLFATLFKDVVTAVTKNFPILNLFGPKGSGKSELGHSLMSFFVINNEPPNLSSATDAALADTVAQCANALVHIDEYKNSIELNRREFIKGLYDGVGRTRMNMDRDKKRETTAVDCGVILSGQEMPTIDIAIFSRLLFLTFNTSEFSVEAKRKFDDLKTWRNLGCSHLTLQLLMHRKRVEANFAGNYKVALADILASVDGDMVEDRILRNWVIPLAIFRTLEGVVDVAWAYRDMLSLCVAGVRRQNRECRSTNELANFWAVVDYLHQNGEVFIDADYRIKYETSFRGKGMRDKIEWQRARPILYLCPKRIMMLYKKNGKIVGDATLPVESLRFYLENSKEYIGTKYAVRFKNLSNVRESTMEVTGASGMPSVQATSRTDWALCFDYQLLMENYNINLEVDGTAIDD